MKITDIFIRRPVLACVVSLLILVLGLRSMQLLPVRQFPFTQNAVVTVTTVYTGADPDLIAGFITTPMEGSIAQAQGIDYLTSISTQSVSTISANLVLNYDPNVALTDISTKVNAVINQLPRGSQQPVLSVEVGETIASMYIGFYSDILPPNKITDYLIRVVQPKLQAVSGVQQAEILGSQKFALRAWLDPIKMAAVGVTATDVNLALANNDFLAAVGQTKGQTVVINLTTDTGLHSVEEFRNLIIKAKNGALVRLSDVAKVELGADSYTTRVSFDGKDAVYMGIKVAPAANLLTVIDNIRKVFPEIVEQLPNGLEAKIVYDATKYVNSSIHEVEQSLIEAILIVTGVIFLFLGSIRSVIIPVVAIPLSLIGAFFFMLALGYSINLLTLLALVLAIGLVVDDAIIVVENIHRHIEEGMRPFEAAIRGARELANPIIAITVVLVAVYVPIGFMGGLTGALFTEFAFTLVAAVTISAIIALTLSPMMCAKLLKPINDKTGKNRLMEFVDTKFAKLQNSYERLLRHVLDYLPVVMVFAVIILVSIYFLYATARSELAPQEDQGILISSLTANPDTALDQTIQYSRQVFKVMHAIPETDHIFQLDGVSGLNTSIGGMVLDPWDERQRTADQIQPEVQAGLSQIAGVQAAVFQPPPLPGGGSGLPFQFLIVTTENFEHLNTVSQNFLNAMRATGMFMFLDTDLKYDKPQTSIILDRNKIAQLGLTMQDVGTVLSSALSGDYINYFSMAGRSYQVIPQVLRVDRLNAEQILNYYIKNSAGTMIPLSTVATLKTLVVPQSLNHFQQLNSANIGGVLMPGVTQGEALDKVREVAKQLLPQGYTLDYAGQTRQYTKESTALIVTFFFALIIIFLSLAALFESFRDPIIVLISVPMSICGALIFISLGVKGASLNIYTEVGLVTLIGLISKHGILIVQFANDLQHLGKNKRQAIEEAAGIRLRPILMTTAAMVLGVVPLLLANGAGAVSRFNIGLVISSGISIGTLFTLFVVPAMYLLLATEKKADQDDELMIEEN